MNQREADTTQREFKAKDSASQQVLHDLEPRKLFVALIDVLQRKHYITIQIKVWSQVEQVAVYSLSFPLRTWC